MHAFHLQVNVNTIIKQIAVRNHTVEAQWKSRRKIERGGKERQQQKHLQLMAVTYNL